MTSALGQVKRRHREHSSGLLSKSVTSLSLALSVVGQALQMTCHALIHQHISVADTAQGIGGHKDEKSRSFLRRTRILMKGRNANKTQAAKCYNTGRLGREQQAFGGIQGGFPEKVMVKQRCEG